jgi:tetratricopeptide (TPR) repeat protein
VLAQVVHANTLAALNKFDAALAELQHAIALDPTRSASYSDLGVIQFASGSPRNAEESFKEAIEASPKEVDPYLSLGTFYWLQNRLPEAETAMKQAVALDPRNVAANRALATFYIGSNRPADAERHLKSVAEISRTAESQITLADYYLTQNRIAEAIAVLNTAAKEQDGYAEARSRLAAIDYAAGRTAEAHKSIDETLVKRPSHPRALMTKAQFLLVENKIDEALTRVRAAVTADSRSVDAHYTLGSIYASKGDVDEAIKEFNAVLTLSPRSVAAQMELARLNLARGEAARATDYARQAVKGRPTDLGLRALLVRSLISKGDVAGAETELRVLLEQFPKVSELHWLAGTIHLQKNELAAARESFDRALTLQPDALEALDSLVALDLRTGNIAKARAVLEPRLAQRPNDSALLVLTARLHEVAGELDASERSLRKAIEVDPSNRQPYEMLGHLYLSQKKLDAALIEFDEVARRDSKSVSAQTMAGMILQVQNRMPEAQKRYERALEINPNAVVAANNLAWFYAENGGNLDLALQLAQAAKAQITDQPDINDTLGWVYMKKDLAALAIPPFRISVEKAPNNPSYHYHLGLAYAKTGNVEGARKSLETAIKLKPDFEGADDARRVLASLGR